MAIALDSSASNNSTATSATFSHTVSGSERVIIVGVSTRKASSPQITHTSVTYNGVSLTKGVEYTENGDSLRSSIWYLVAPSTGANDVVVTVNANGGANPRLHCFSASFTGVDQTTPIGNSAGADNSGTDVDVSITPTYGNGVFYEIFQGTGNAISLDSGQTSLGEFDNTSTPILSTEAAYHPFTTITGYIESASESSQMETGLVLEIKKAAETLTASPTESISLTEGTSVFKTLVSTVSDALSLVENIVKVVIYQLTSTDSVSLSDTISTVKDLLWTRESKPSTTWTNENKY